MSRREDGRHSTARRQDGAVNPGHVAPSHEGCRLECERLGRVLEEAPTLEDYRRWQAQGAPDQRTP